MATNKDYKTVDAEEFAELCHKYYAVPDAVKRVQLRISFEDGIFVTSLVRLYPHKVSGKSKKELFSTIARCEDPQAGSIAVHVIETYILNEEESHNDNG